MSDRAARRNPLNDIALKNLKAPAEGVTQFPDGKIAGMGVRVTAGGVKSFYLEYRFKGAKHRLNLGRYPVTSLQKARAKAHAALVMLSEGKNPQQGEQEQGRTFGTALADFLEGYCRHHNRASTASETERVLRLYFAHPWERRTVESITRADVSEIIAPIMARGAPAAARHAFAAVRKFFNWQVEQGRLAVSPCVGMKPPAKAGQRDRVLTPDELKAIWTAAEAQGYPFGRIVQLLMLTAQRRSEVSSMTWDEIDSATAVWTIPAERTKNGKPHAVPLSPAVMTILAAIPRVASPYVFPARGLPEQPFTGWSKSKRKLDADANLHDWTLHDLRRTAATGLARQGIPPHIVERVLNHVSGTFSGVAGIYNRHQYADEMRAALDQWAKMLEVIADRKTPVS